jgi:hypothetical protein
MERLSLHDNPGGSHQVPNPQQEPPPQNAAGQPTTQGGPPQLPPQMFTTAAQLLDLTDSECALFSMMASGISRATMPALDEHFSAVHVFRQLFM